MQDMISTFGNPSMMHAVAVHTPIALAMLGVPLIVLMAFVQRDRHTIRSLTLLAYVLLVGSTIVAVQTGNDAMDALPPTQSAEVAELVQKHGDMAEWVAWMAGLTALFIALSYVPVPKVRLTAVVLAFLAASATAGWVGATGHHGGTLVYEHGAGTPLMEHWGKPQPRETLPGEPPSDTEEAVEDDYYPAIRPIDMDDAAAVSFQADVMPIMEIYCIHCHEGRRPDGDYDMTTAEGIIGAGAKFEVNVIPGEPDDSPLIQYIRGILQPQMPRGEEPIPEDDLHTLRLWIAAGAEDDSDNAAE